MKDKIYFDFYLFSEGKINNIFTLDRLTCKINMIWTIMLHSLRRYCIYFKKKFCCSFLNL